MTTDTMGMALLGFVWKTDAEAVAKIDGLSTRATTASDLIAVTGDDFDPDDALETLTTTHERLVTLARDASVLPVRIGTMITEDESVVVDEKVRTLMKRISGRVEARVDGTYVEDDLLDAIADRVPRTVAADRLELGRKVAAEISGQRQRDTGKIEAALSAIVEDHQTRPVGDAKLCDLSLLIDRDMIESLDNLLKELVETEMPYARFRIVAPLPAYSFAE